MKKTKQLIVFLLVQFFIAQTMIAQIPAGFNYQAVIRNNDGSLLKNHIVKARFTILDNDSMVVFTESNAFNTNEYGLINIVIGKDNTAFENINWSNGPYDLKVEIDTGSGFEDLGITKIYAVPYANLAKDVVNNDDADTDPANEIQSLTFNAATNELSISNGNSVTIPTGETDADADPENEIQTLTKSGNQIILSKEGGSVTDEVNDADADPANELQILSVSGDQLTISSGNTVTLPSSSTGDQWGSQVVESDNSLSGDGTNTKPLSVNKKFIVFERNGTTIHQISSYDTDDFILGREALPVNGENVTGKMLFFDKSKGAFRAGNLNKSDIWSPKNIGSYSFAVGYNTKASGSYSTAMGLSTIANGNYSSAMGRYSTASSDYSTALGYNTTASGKISTAMGYSTTAPSYNETVFGRYNTKYTPNSADAWDDDDRLFVIGNGTSSSARHNALTIIKNGKTGIGTDTPAQKLEVSGKLKVGDDEATPTAGTIRWNSTTNDFEGYTGTEWLSLTKSNTLWGEPHSNNENYSITADDGAANDFFGQSVSISGDYAIVGAYLDDVGGNGNQGSAYIFHKSGNNWSQQAKITADDGADNDNFGKSVSISGDYAIVGAFFDKVAGKIDQGSAYIFHRSGANWTLQTKITASDGAAEDWFGASVSISGDYTIVGANGDDVGGNADQGSVYIFHRSGATWTQLAKITASDGAAVDHFGTSISISGNYAIVGASGDDVGGNSGQGSAYIFHRSGANWTQQAKITASDGASEDLFGRSVSISGDYAIVGADYDDVGSNSNQGSAYIFHRSGVSWTQQAHFTAPDGTVNDYFGKSVSMWEDYAIVGAIGYDEGGNTEQGSAYIFHRSGSIWSQQTYITASDGAAHDHFGKSVSISGDYAIVGASDYGVGVNTQQGSAYIFKK